MVGMPGFWARFFALDKKGGGWWGEKTTVLQFQRDEHIQFYSQKNARGKHSFCLVCCLYKLNKHSFGNPSYEDPSF